VLKKSLGNKGVGCGQTMRAKNNIVKNRYQQTFIGNGGVNRLTGVKLIGVQQVPKVESA
jgi:hypothetical protein